jgi:serine O-acetyltransferase
MLFILCSIVAFWLITLIFFWREVKGIQERDPAASSPIEVVLLYPGLHAIVFHRIAHKLWALKIPFFPRAISQFARTMTGIEIHPGARIGKDLFIDHGMGVVIGETTIIGNSVTLYQGVTLGGTGKETGKRHPTIGDNVVIGTGAKVLGNITISSNSYIGANAVVLESVPPNSTVVGVPGHITRQDGEKIDKKLDHAQALDPITRDIEEMTRRLDTLEKRVKS